MQLLALKQYEDLCKNAKVLAEDRHGPKLLALEDDLFVKIFRRKKLISSALWEPYARRFQKNTEALANLGIPTVNVSKVAYCRPKKRHLVYYAPLPGATLRDFLSGPVKEEKIPVLEKFAGFLANLHHKGVFFRSIHFGNVIVSPDRENLSLIDVADLYFYSSTLSIDKRLRNFKHFLRYREDFKILYSYGISRFLDIYTLKSSLTSKESLEIQNLFNTFHRNHGFPPLSNG